MLLTRDNRFISGDYLEELVSREWRKCMYAHDADLQAKRIQAVSCVERNREHPTGSKKQRIATCPNDMGPSKNDLRSDRCNPLLSCSPESQIDWAVPRTYLRHQLLDLAGVA